MRWADAHVGVQAHACAVAYVRNMAAGIRVYWQLVRVYVCGCVCVHPHEPTYYIVNNNVIIYKAPYFGFAIIACSVTISQNLNIGPTLWIWFPMNNVAIETLARKLSDGYYYQCCMSHPFVWFQVRLRKRNHDEIPGAYTLWEYVFRGCILP